MSKMFALLCIVLFINCVKAKNNTKNSNKTVHSVICASDYREVAKKKYFIDQSLLIIEFFDGPKAMLVTAPSLFGKSTIVDMLKRFFEITTTNFDKFEYIEKTENYHLFTNSRLKISRCKQFIKRHLGKYPVIHINFEPLNEMRNTKEMMNMMRVVMHRTFIQHSYLQKNASLWNEDIIGKEKTVFVTYVNNLKLNKYQIVNGFTFLSRVLFDHYNREIIVLVDGYDTFMQTLLFRKDGNMDKIIAFMSKINQDLMKVNQYTKKVFITGVLNIVDKSLIPPLEHVGYHWFLRSNPFSKYFGVDDIELPSLLITAKTDHELFNETMTEIQFYYNGYLIESRNQRISNPWSVLNYFENNKTIERYWCSKKHYKSLVKVFRIQEIAEEINQLLIGNVSIGMNISEPLSKRIIKTVRMLAKDSVVGMRYHIDCFLTVLYNLGYLTGTVQQVNGTPISTLRIPNREILLEFSTFVQESHVKRSFHFSQDIRKFNEAIDSFRPDAIRHETFQNLHKTLRVLLLFSTHSNQSKRDIQGVLFVNLVQRFPGTELDVPVPLNPEVRVPETIDLLLMNLYGVRVVFELTLLENKKPQANELENAASMCYNRLLKKYQWFVSQKHDDDHKYETVCVGISFYKYTKLISIASSFISVASNQSLNPIITD